jgi:hypothetical protein
LDENTNRLTIAAGTSNREKTKMSKIVFAVLFATVTLLSASSAQAKDVTFNHPKYGGYALDWCLKWNEVSCGAPVAQAYCKSQGYSLLTGFKKWNDPHIKTKLMRSTKICDLTICDSFEVISCR